MGTLCVLCGNNFVYSAVTTFRLVYQRFGKMYIILIAILKFNVSANK